MKNKLSDIFIIVLGGALKKTAGIWHTTSFQDKGDLFGIAGDRLRVLAAKELYQSLRKKNYFQNIHIVASGGKGQLKYSGAPFLSQVLKKELIEAGVPSRAIIEERRSNNTYEQLKESANILKKKNIKNIILISNRYHFPRIKAFIAYDNNLKNMFRAIKFKSAEDILIKSNAKKWSKFLQKIYASHDMKMRISQEKKGIRQIKNGSYDFTIVYKNKINDKVTFQK